MWDINRFTGTGTKINLWHGSPIKKVGADSGSIQQGGLASRVFPFNHPQYRFFSAGSETVAGNFRSAFPNVDEFLISGYPRNDALKNQSDDNIILYLPTHRKEGQSPGAANSLFSTFDVDQIEEALARMNATLVLKMHYYDRQFAPDIASPQNQARGRWR